MHELVPAPTQEIVGLLDQSTIQYTRNIHIYPFKNSWNLGILSTWRKQSIINVHKLDNSCSLLD